MATQALARFLFGMGQVGVAMTITYYFLFAAEVSGMNHFARRGWLLASHLPGVLVVFSCCFGPLNSVFVRWEGDGASQFSYGPVGNALIVALYGLVLTGAMLQLASHYESRADRFALPHMAFALAGILPLVANVFWVARQPLGLSLPFNPTVVAFVVANLAMLGALKAWCRRTSRCAPGASVVVPERRVEGA